MPRLAEKALTAKAVERAKRPRTGRIEIPDGVVRGLCLRVSHTGVKSFIFSTRVRGRLVRRSIGTYPLMSLWEARQNAAELRENPAKLATLRKREPEPKVKTFGDLVEDYIKRGMRSSRTGEPLKRAHHLKSMIRNDILPEMGHVALAEVRKRDVIMLTDSLIDEGKKAKAVKIHEIIRRIGNFAVERDELEVSPFAGMKPPAVKVARERVLGSDEIAPLWRAWDEMGYPFGDLQKILLITGQRRGEVAGMQWDEVHLDSASWIIPAERTKSGREMEVPLPSLAMEILHAVPRFTEGPYVFTTMFGRRPVGQFSRNKDLAGKLSGVTGWRLHDLRRTVRTGLAELGVPEIVAERVLNHSEGDVLVKTYNRHHYSDEKREALERWARRLREIVSTAPENLVRMERTQ